jgi:hypothetical protein
MGTNVFWELTRLRRYLGGTTSVAFYVLGVVALGIVAPLYLRFEFLELPALLIYACLPCLFVPPVVAESIASESERELRPAAREQRRDWLYGKVGAAAVYGWVSVVLILVLAFISLGVATGRVIAPPMLFLVGLALISLASTLFAASFAAAVSVGASSARGVKRAMRQGLLLLVVVFLFVYRQPWSWKRRFPVPETGQTFLEFALLVSVVLAGLSAVLIRLALHASEPAEIRLNL